MEWDEKLINSAEDEKILKRYCPKYTKEIGWILKMIATTENPPNLLEDVMACLKRLGKTTRMERNINGVKIIVKNVIFFETPK